MTSPSPTFPELWGPDPYDDPMSVYGPIAGAHQVEAAVLEVVRTWGWTYFNEICRRAGLAPGTLPAIRSWRVSSEMENMPEDQHPAVIVRSLSAQALRRGGGQTSHQQTWRWVVEVGVQTVTRSVKTNGAVPQPRMVALMYATALRMALIQKRDQAKLLGMVDVEAERYTELDSTADRSTHLATVVCGVQVHNVAEWGRGPATPMEPDDGIPGPDDPTWPVAETVETSVDKAALDEPFDPEETR